MSDTNFSIQLKAEIAKTSISSIQSEIKKLGSDNKLKLQVDTSNITSSIKKAIESAYKSVGKLKLPPIGSNGNSGLSSTVSQYKSEYQQLMTIARQMSSTKIKIAGLDTSKNKSEIESLTKQLTEFKTDYSSLLKSIGGNLSTDQWSKLQAVVENTDDKITTLKAKMADSIQYKIDVGDYETQIVKIQSQFEKWGMTEEEVETNMRSLTTAYKAMINLSGDERIQAEKEYQKALQSTKNQIVQLSATTASSVQTTTLSNNIQTWLDKNTNASKEAQVALHAYLSELKGEIPLTQFRNIEQGFKNITTAQRQAGNLGKSFVDTFKSGAQKFTEWFGISAVIMKGVQTVKEMYQAVYDIDTEMTELAKVSDATVTQLNEALEGATKTAKTYGAIVSDVVSATADWSRLGYDLDASQQLAEVATIYKNVGDGIDIDTANESLVSTLQGFQLEADEALSIIDKFNEVANNFPIDTAGIGEALQRSAASFYAANTDLSESIALITGTNSVVQDPDSVGKHIVPTFTVMCC